ncbi:MAG: Sigma factor sigB regulation protein rsbU [Pseudomonadota bacterium]|jgi:sigma-B regulation protein RsbU (phosphoserine phosphatase)
MTISNAMSWSDLSLKYKVMILLTVVPLLLLGSYLLLVINVFEKDKIAYIYDTNSNVNRSLASQARGTFQTILASVKPVLQDRVGNGEFGMLSRETFNGESNLLFIGLLDSSKSPLTLKDHLKKNPEDLEDFIASLQQINQLVNGYKDETHLVRTPFKNENILLIESIENPIDKSVLKFAIVFRSQELADLFSAKANQSLFLATDSGDFLFGYQEKVTQKKNTPTILDSEFFKVLKKKNSTEGTELVERKKSGYLVSYNKIGFGKLIVTSIVDREKALSAIKTLVTKSLLFAGILLSITLLLSIIGSQTLTKALRDLLSATQRIAQGEFTFRVNVPSKDEIGSLATSFNLMSTEVARLLNETAEKARMEGELQTARTVQETLFPPTTQVFGNVHIAGHYEPASECGGDWWYYAKINKRIMLCIGDATGHGAPAALITSAARSAASVMEHFTLDAKQIMRLLNRSIYDVSRGRVMMTFFLGIIDTETGVFTYCNASHEAPYLLKADIQKPRKKDLKPLIDVNNARLGQDPATVYEQTSFQLDPNDFIFFYTDGIADIQSPSGQSLGEREFLRIILETMPERSNPPKFVNMMNNSLQSYRTNTTLVDDVTFFCVKYGDAA